MSEVLNDIINEWKIQKNVVQLWLIVGQNIKAAIRLLNIDHVSCTAHLLNNIVMNSLKLNTDEDINDDSVSQTEIKNVP